ncbi:MAG: hypothetical protein MZV65_28915 [Chromatiales bacterium]|nr:hypothetical protein [Chromatiales bacterium]
MIAQRHEFKIIHASPRHRMLSLQQYCAEDKDYLFKSQNQNGIPALLLGQQWQYFAQSGLETKRQSFIQSGRGGYRWLPQKGKLCRQWIRKQIAKIPITSC